MVLFSLNLSKFFHFHLICVLFCHKNACTYGLKNAFSLHICLLQIPVCMEEKAYTWFLCVCIINATRPRSDRQDVRSAPAEEDITLQVQRAAVVYRLFSKKNLKNTQIKNINKAVFIESKFIISQFIQFFVSNTDVHRQSVYRLQ